MDTVKMEADEGVKDQDIFCLQEDTILREMKKLT